MVFSFQHYLSFVERFVENMLSRKYPVSYTHLKQPGVSIIQTRDVRPANTLERIAYERYVLNTSITTRSVCHGDENRRGCTSDPL